MFRTASSVIAGRICVWLAAAMLAFPFVPSSSCRCSDENSIEQCYSAKLRHEDKSAITRGCCASSKRPETSTCCAKSNQWAVPNTDGPCDCGPTSDCHLSRHSEPRPAAPTPPTRNGSEQLQSAMLTHAATMAVAAVADSPFVARAPRESSVETALDRCITLSRFLC